MHLGLGSATLSQMAFHRESNTNILWEKTHWDNAVVKSQSKVRRSDSCSPHMMKAVVLGLRYASTPSVITFSVLEGCCGVGGLRLLTDVEAVVDVGMFVPVAHSVCSPRRSTTFS